MQGATIDESVAIGDILMSAAPITARVLRHVIGAKRMTIPSTKTSPKWGWSQMVKIAVGAAMFGVLMSVRHEAENIWTRAALAACAGLALGAAVLWAFGRKN
jgi:hypothetical protein